MGRVPIVDPANRGRKTKSTFLPGKAFVFLAFSGSRIQPVE
jgi:hypothetical protein